MSGFLNLGLATVVALLPIANPFSTAAVFLAITRGASEDERRGQARRACIYMFWILVVFLLAGTAIMRFFGISLPGLRIAGGLMIARVALGMVRSPGAEDRPGPEAEREARHKEDVSFTPLAMPSLSGPGAIAVTIGLATETDHWSDFLAIVLGIAAVAVICFLVLAASTRIMRFLGVNGLNALTRIMGFLLLCIGVQFIVNGVLGALLQEPFLGQLRRALGGG